MKDLFNTQTIFASMIWGAVGSGIFIFGWRQKSTLPVVGGLLMIGASYFISSALLMSLVSIVIIAVMYWVKRQGY